MTIRNINGIPDPGCPGGSWMEYWEKMSGQKTTYCLVAGCMHRDLAGARVQKADTRDDGWYIYPLCSLHNEHAEELEVSNGYKLIPMEQVETREP